MASSNNLFANTLSSLFKAGLSGPASSQDQLVLVTKHMMKYLAHPLLEQMGLLDETRGDAPVALLDSACGTGVVTQELQATLPKQLLERSSFVMADSSEALVGIVTKRIADEGWVNTEAKVLDAMNTGLPENSFSHVAVALGLHLIPQPDDVVRDCQRILKPGGIFGATTFNANAPDKVFWQPDMRSAFASFPFDAPFPDKIPFQTHTSGTWTSRDWVESHLASLGGFADVQVKLVPGTYRVASGEEWVFMFGSMLTWVTNTWWTEEMRAAHPMEEVKGLIQKHLEEKYGGEGWDVSWELICATARVE